ncbi:MAG: hypothetical protein EPN97_01615 [Alphaproteobacteria bacterium]|nr:MAG: hypothetical protein EPN97_01615 [Alphaproteobacteria bacterium]
MTPDATSPHDHNLRMRFLSAAEIGAVDIARDILYQGVLNQETLDRALALAAGEGQSDFVRFLVEEIRMDISRAGPDVLAQAVRDRETAVVDVLTLQGSLPLTPETPLEHHYLDLALVGSNPYSGELLQLLLDRGAQPVAGGFDALNTALREHNSDALQRFMRREPALSRRLGEKLVSAAMRFDAVEVEMLLQNGAPAGYSNNTPMASLIYQVTDLPGRDAARIFDCARLLLAAGGADAGMENELLLAAVQTKNTRLIGLLLERGADIEPQMRGIGYNPMVLAATYGFNDIVDKLHGAGATRPDAYAEALATAAEKGNGALVDKILRYGVDVSQTDLTFCAAVGGQLDLVKTLVAKGYTTDFRDKTLLEAVVEGDHGAMLDYLLDQGADRNRAQELYVNFSNRRSKPYAEVHKTLKAWSERGETVLYTHDYGTTLKELRRTEPDYRDQPLSGFVKLAKANRFAEAMQVARAEQSDRLEKADLLSTDGAGNTVLEILGARGQLPMVFAPSLWEKRQEDFAAIYAEIAPVYRPQVDFQELVSTWRQQALAKAKTKIPKLKR